MKSRKDLILYIGIVFGLLFTRPSSAQNGSQDTLRVMEYNTLGFGNANTSNCQAMNQSAMPALYAELKAIIQFANPDIIGLDKMQSVNTGPTDFSGLSAYTFPDTVLAECMNSTFPDRYAYCPFTDLSRGGDQCSSIVFYDKTKLVYVSTTPMYYNYSDKKEDFDMFKFYYNTWEPVDTTYLYVILCHTSDNGSVNPSNNGQDSIVMNKLRTMFTQLPNLIYMGDFNTRQSTESGYSYITQTSNSNYTMYDPPFNPDAKLTYPAIWHSGTTYQAYFTTTTRTTTTPNSCGTTGGGKDWYDHIFLSPSIVNGTNNLTYVRNSYTTIGNDGHRGGVAVNSGTNTSAPANVINALFNFSDKYPVEVTIAVNPVLAVKNIESTPGSIRVNNPISNNLVMHFASFLNGQNATMEVYDICGRALYQSIFTINNSTISKDISLTPGVYFIHFTSGGYGTTLKVVKE